MSHLLKRTKKTCLKFIRKLSSSKQLYIKQMEDDDISMKTTVQTDVVNDQKPTDVKKTRDIEDSTHKTHNSNNEAMPFSSYCWKSYDPDDTDDNESEDGRGHRNMILENLTSKLFITANGYEFQRMQQLQSDGPPTAEKSTSDMSQQSKDKIEQEQEREREQQQDEEPEHEQEKEATNIFFERVKYKEHVRYFRHTPSSSSLDNFTNQSNTTNARVTTSPPTSKTNTITHQATTDNSYHSTFMDGSNSFLPINLSLGSKKSGNYQNVYISEERDLFNKKTPIVKWDINGNSLDDDNIFISDHWSDFDIEGSTNATFSNIFDKRCAQLKYDGSQKSNSYRSSSTTLETWLEDEYIENNGDLSLRNNNEFPSNNCLMKT